MIGHSEIREFELSKQLHTAKETLAKCRLSLTEQEERSEQLANAKREANGEAFKLKGELAELKQKYTELERKSKEEKR